jgi:hypothetical protein
VSGFSRSQRPVTAAGPGLPTIEALELKALAAFDIDPSEATTSSCAKVGGEHDEELEPERTVESYHLHQDQKVALAARAPFGSGS